jgi:hypothetical protein
MENRNKCADISLEISAIRCEISAEICERCVKDVKDVKVDMRKMEAAEINKIPQL